jgi:chitinase
VPHRRFIFFAASILLAAATCLPMPATAADRVMVGYYATFADLKIEDIPYDRLTHLCHAFLTSDDEGRPVTGEQVPSRELTDTAHKHNVKVLLSLGGGNTTAAFERVTADEKSRTTYVDEVVKLVVENGYDGIDLDWEFPRSEATTKQFTELVTALRAKLDGAAKIADRKEPYLLTAAVSSSEFFGKFIDTDAVMGKLDWLNVMTYDYSGPWDRVVGHNAPLLASPDDPARSWRSVETSMNYWHNDRKVPAEKLVVGLALYGRAFPVKAKYSPIDRTQKDQHGVLTFAQIRKLIDQKWSAEWDEDIQAPWLVAPGDKPLLVAYDDRNSIYKKSAWARGEGYRGVFFWTIHQDRMDNGEHWLIEAAYKAWPK